MNTFQSIFDNLFERYYYHYETLMYFGAIMVVFEFTLPLVVKRDHPHPPEYTLDLLWSVFKIPFVFLSVYILSNIFSPMMAGGEYVRSILPNIPFWIDCILGLMLADLVTYWRHRLTHLRWLWPFHAVHHGSRQLNWLSNERFHPVNSFVSILALFPIMMTGGFSYEVMMVVNLVIRFANIFNHSNTRLHFGPLNYIFVAPIFHRWHHSSEPAARDKNFSVVFSFWDLLFGTFYLPKGIRPVRTGVPEIIPNNLWGQLLYPFKVTWSQLASLTRRRRSADLLRTP